MASDILFNFNTYNLLGGVLLDATPTGGIAFKGGATGGAAWVSLAFSGNHGLQIQSNNGGILEFDTSVPGINHTVSLTDVFTFTYQLLDVVPDEILIQVYEFISQTWHSVFIGVSDLFGIVDPVPKGAIPNQPGIWINLSVTASDFRLDAADIITGISFGVWKTGATSTVVFSDTSVAYNLFVPKMPPILAGIPTVLPTTPPHTYSDVNWQYYHTSFNPVLYDFDDINASIENILGTRIGERVMLRQFGSNLISLVFEPCNQKTAFAILSEIDRALSTWEPRINILFANAQVIPDPDNNAFYISIPYQDVVTGAQGVFSKSVLAP